MANRFNSNLSIILLAALTVVTSSALAQTQGSGAPAASPPSSTSPTPDTRPVRKPIRAGRLFVWDLEGTWLSKGYVAALKDVRAPHAAARKAAAVAIKVEKVERSYPVVFTDFRHAVRQYLIDIEPDNQPNSYRLVTAEEDAAVSSAEATYIRFRGKKNDQGKLNEITAAEPNFSKGKLVAFERTSEALELLVNRLTIAGKYRDAEGRAYEFSESGDAILPDRKFVFELSLDPQAAKCELILSHHEREPQGTERIGFDWNGKQLRLFNAKAAGKDRYTCEAKPFAVLSPA